MSKTNNELDKLVRQIHFSAASLDELTDQELYEYTDDTCQRVIDEAKAAIQQLIDEAYKKGYIDGGIYAINGNYTGELGIKKGE